ncbi:glycoside hydrolase family 28 protein [Rhizobium lentis]|uniref:Glycoside hydrolase family 28 protein n=1 Tax=Rhizobium lentis TaxID=1138194 RepID=A0A9Q3MCG2_9HYPH|nr:glycoside hydrolase family 28 protein [Rhizobium lentis]MBX5012576.1 glycoside hydrolase family 28 protein [Rhizobium lentis]MBX5024175.1 glycoside hydrolase family 28 protein [Rhizobium lentis]MBX5039458.1 glycoside hydrolase family 28 protein [Rhizobium lentis]MBX5050421.1 glycoside hydrolase family 28 protein [Rhizobium lentis]MBX5052151.1 glycoside hydrolase family 28 protein [Rhizobium lentis]
MSASSLVAIEALDGDNTDRLQSEIDSLSVAGGGRLELLAGIHLCRGLRLHSGVDLHLAAGAILRPVPDYAAYAHTTVSVVAEKSDRGMIVANGARRISLTGEGRIEAGCDNFITGDDESVGTFIPAEFRPRVVVFEGCDEVEISSVTISRSPMWTLHFVDCTDLTVRNVTIENDRRLPNTDGIVLDACRGAVIEDCRISTADDGICLKTSIGPQGVAIGRCENILIRRCSVESLSCALKIGTETHGDVSNVLFEDCNVSASNRALGIFSRDGGRISNVRFSRIAVECRETPDGFWGSGEALTVNVIDRVAERPAGAIENLIVEDVTGRMEGAITVIAAAPSGIRNVSLARIAIDQQAGTLGTGRTYDLRPTNADLAPRADGGGRANAWTRGSDGRVIGLQNYPGGMPAVYVADVTGISMNEVRITRPAPLPQGWNENDVIFETATSDGSGAWQN